MANKRKREATLKRVEKWLAELRSGKYEQGTARLEQANGRMCCLGVAAKHVLKIKGELNNYLECVVYDGDASLLDAHEKIGLWDSHGTFRNSRGRLESLAALNDSGKSFKQIANTIEWGLRHKKSQMFQCWMYDE